MPKNKSEAKKKRKRSPAGVKKKPWLGIQFFKYQNNVHTREQRELQERLTHTS